MPSFKKALELGIEADILPGTLETARMPGPDGRSMYSDSELGDKLSSNSNSDFSKFWRAVKASGKHPRRALNWYVYGDETFEALPEKPLPAQSSAANADPVIGGIAKNIQDRRANFGEHVEAYNKGEQGALSTAYGAVAQGVGLVGDVLNTAATESVAGGLNLLSPGQPFTGEDVSMAPLNILDSMSRDSAARWKELDERIKGNKVDISPDEVEGLKASIANGYGEYLKWRVTHPTAARNIESTANIANAIFSMLGVRRLAGNITPGQALSGIKNELPGLAKESLAAVTTKPLKEFGKAALNTAEKVPGIGKVSTMIEGAAFKTKQAGKNVVKNLQEFGQESSYRRVLPKYYQEALNTGIEEGAIDDILRSPVNDKKAFRDMFSLAEAKEYSPMIERKVKEIPAKLVQKQLSHITQARDGLGGMGDKIANSLTPELVDVTDSVYKKFNEFLAQKGLKVMKIEQSANVSNKLVQAKMPKSTSYKIVPAESIGGKPVPSSLTDTDIAFLEKIHAQMAPNSAGRVKMAGKTLHNLRKNWFAEYGIEGYRDKKLVTYSDDLARGVDGVRGEMSKVIDGLPGGSGYIDFAGKYKNIMDTLKEASRRFKIKSKLTDINEKNLKIGEVSQRMLGNSAAEYDDLFSSIEELAKLHGYDATAGSVRSQVWFARYLDEFFKRSGTSLGGNIDTALAKKIPGARGLLKAAGELADPSHKARIDALKKIVFSDNLPPSTQALQRRVDAEGLMKRLFPPPQ